MTKQYFTYDPANNEFDEFDNEDDAIKAAQAIIDDYLQDGIWNEGVDRIVVGVITHRAEPTNFVSENMLDENGEYNGKCYQTGNCEDWCDYEMLPVDDTGEPNR